MAKHRQKSVATPASLVGEIRTELRSIIRQFEDIARPLDSFDGDPRSPKDKPRYYVNFGRRRHIPFTGLKLMAPRMFLADEQVDDAVLNLAKSVWHLKDRLHQWIKRTGAAADVKTWSDGCSHLLVCGDLANWKKHGRTENLSGLEPKLTEVFFDLTKSGGVEYFFDGSTKHQELIVTNPVPIPFTPRLILKGEPEPVNAIIIIHSGFRRWVDLIEQLGVLAGDGRENRVLRETLFVPSKTST